ncbi:hypothetical protein vBCtySFA70_00065 [Clostridium phage vB_CtyS-FA70]|nr:hypothetical protein vBCtySFA70_00065 [Clostridium phage vB_CtyS-FA70]
MKINFKGKITSEQQLINNIMEVVSTIGKRSGVPENTAFVIVDPIIKVAFLIDGEERYATVPRKVGDKDINELFEVKVTLDEKGDIAGSVDNEDESFADPYSMAKAVGVEYQYEGIESEYDDTKLKIVESIGDNTDIAPMAVRYEIEDDSKHDLVRHFKGNKLVAEYLINRDEVIQSVAEADEQKEERA